MLGHAGLALEYSQGCLDYCEHQPCEPCDLAFAHAEVRLAAGVAGESDRSERHLEQARLRGEEIADEEDEKIFHMELRRMVDRLERERKTER